LLDNLDDPITKNSLGLLNKQDESISNDSISDKKLPRQVENDFIKALRQVLQGLMPIEISKEEIQQALFCSRLCIHRRTNKTTSRSISH